MHKRDEKNKTSYIDNELVFRNLDFTLNRNEMHLYLKKRETKTKPNTELND